MVYLHQNNQISSFSCIAPVDTRKLSQVKTRSDSQRHQTRETDRSSTPCNNKTLENNIMNLELPSPLDLVLDQQYRLPFKILNKIVKASSCSLGAAISNSTHKSTSRIFLLSKAMSFTFTKVPLIKSLSTCIVWLDAT